MKDSAGRRLNDGAVLPSRSSGPMIVGLLVTLLLAPFGPLIAGEVKEARFLLSWGTKGDQPGEFSSPIGIAISAKDEVFVTDVNNARLQRFTADGKHLGGFDLPRDTPDAGPTRRAASPWTTRASST